MKDSFQTSFIIPCSEPQLRMTVSGGNWEGFSLNISTIQIGTHAFLLSKHFTRAYHSFRQYLVRDLMADLLSPTTELYLDIQGLVNRTKTALMPITDLTQQQIQDIEKMWGKTKDTRVGYPGRQHLTLNSPNTKSGTNNNTRCNYDCANWNVLLSTSPTQEC